MFHQGHFQRSLELAERALAGYDPSLAGEYLARLGESPAVRYHCWAAHALWFLGREQESLEHLDAAVSEAQAHAYSQTTAQAQAAFLHQYRRDAGEARRWAETTIAISTEHGFPFRVAQASILRGWALAAQGELDEGAEELGRGLELYRATGAGMDVPYYLGLAAEVAAWRGRGDEARSLVEEARALLPERGFFYEAPLLRLDALLRAREDPGGAVELLAQARSVARAQRASRLEAEIEALLRRARDGEPFGIDDLEAAHIVVDAPTSRP
jgi:predicted ATPase